MADYMGTHGGSDGGMGHGDKGMNAAMMLPHTSLNEPPPPPDMLSQPSDAPGLTSPAFMSRVSAADYSISQSPHQDAFLSHSALTGLAAAAAHHARFAAATGHSPGGPGGSNPLQGMGSPGQSGPSTPQPSPVFGGSVGVGVGVGSGGVVVETSDTGSGGAALSIPYMRQGDNYVCSLCGKTVASKAAITRHIQLTHEKRKPFECNICHRRFGYKNILLEHQNIHFGIKPYSCNLCDKRFAARSNLFQHRLLHMKPYHCEVCNKRFDRADQLQRHLKLHPTSNVLSCNLCHFQATNVEALNTHLKETHPLQIFNTRSRFSSMPGDMRGADLPTQVPLHMVGAAANNAAASALALNLESEAMRKIDSICSQLASKSHPVKAEPVSPSLAASAHAGFPPMSPGGGLNSPPFPVSDSPLPTQGGLFPGDGFMPTNNHSHNASNMMQRGDDGGGGSRASPQHHLLLHPHPQDFPSSLPGSGGGGGGDSPTSTHPFGPRQAAGHFLTPSRRAASVGSIPGIQAFSRQNRLNNGPPPSPHPGQSSSGSVRSSMADSTSNLSEFFSTLQGMIHRSQDIPELQVTISRPKTRQDASTQHNAVSVTGEVPSLSDLLVYYESQGRIYRCQHCKILFEERGLYFLHKSLHGEQSPWECSICHKICADRNDFHLHFVNEQHQAHDL